MMTSPVDTDSYVPVGDFFAEKAVFVTGGTGFLGKVLVEKLLRSCPGVKVIYLLMRPKRGRDVAQRLASITNCELFGRLRAENPAALDKLVPINGDIALPELGISLADAGLLVQSVSVVFHCAATVNFNETLKVAMNINVNGTRRVMDICRKMKGLKALVHVSTCYTNCDLEDIDEVVYPPPYTPHHIDQYTQWMDDELLEHITPKLLGKRPNTYTFTKAIAESVVVNEGGTLPITIVRPSIVISSWAEPVPGWIESLNGPTAVVVATGKGLLRTYVCHGDKITDIIPVDLVINVMVCAAWWVAVSRSYTLTVYNSATGVKNPITWNGFKDFMMGNLYTYPFQEMMWFPALKYQSNVTISKIQTVLFQYLPAYLYDAGMILCGQKPKLVNVQARLIKGCDMLTHFSTGEWHFRGDNVQRLSDRLSPEDANKFRLDVGEINWKDYLKTYLLGIRTHVCKEDPETLPASIRHVRRLLWIHRGFQASCVITVGYLLTFLFSLHSLAGHSAPAQ